MDGVLTTLNTYNGLLTAVATVVIAAATVGTVVLTRALATENRLLSV